MESIAQFIAKVFTAEAEMVGARWQAQAPHHAPRPSEGSAAADPENSTKIVLAVSCAMRNDPGCHDDVMRAGWEFGNRSHSAGISLHSMLKELDLLTAMMLYVCERSLATYPGTSTAADGLSIARRLHRFFSLLTIAAAKGFTHTYVEGLQEHYRILRHDLRNPLGTIRSAMSLMEDPSLTPEMRNSPRFRAMITRNAQSLEQAIGKELSDASAFPPALARQEISLREVALAVRRDLRDDAVEVGCSIDVADDLPTVLTDSTSFELALKSVVAGALRVAREDSPIRIATVATGTHAATLAVSYEPRTSGESPGTGMSLTFAQEIAARGGGRVWADRDGIRLEVPIAPPGTSESSPAGAVAG